MVAQKFQIYGVKITGKYICESKNKSVHFYSCPQAKLSLRFLSLPPREKEFTYSSRTVFSVFFPHQKGERGRIMELKKLPKLNQEGSWSQVLINSTIFATFGFCFVVP